MGNPVLRGSARAALSAALAVLLSLASAPGFAAGIDAEPAPAVTGDPSPSPSPSQEPTPSGTQTPSAEPAPENDAPPSPAPENDAPPPPPPASPAPVPDVGAFETAAAATTAGRIAGADRYAVAVSVSQSGFPAGAPVAFLAQGDDFPDALSAGPAAVAGGGPILLTPSEALPPAVANELTRLAPREVIVLGGTRSVSSSVTDAILQLGIPVKRIAGADRYAVSRETARAFFPSADAVFLSSGEKFPDALAAGGPAGRLRAPMLLVPGSSPELDAATLAVLDELGTRSVVIVGGLATVSQGIEDALRARGGTVERIGGADRFAVSVALAQRFFPAASAAYLTSGLSFPDALAGGALAGLRGAPMYSIPSDCPHGAVLDDALTRLAVSEITILGGTATISSEAEKLRACVSTAQARWDSQVALVSKLESAMAGLPGEYQVSVRELGGLGRSVDVRGDALVEPASVIKLFAAYVILDRIDRGQLGWNTPTRSGVSVQECLRVMIHISDNACHADLLAIVGNTAINQKLWAEGFTETFYVGYDGAGRYQAAKKSSTSDVVELLSRLERGTLLSVSSTAHLQALLTEQLWRSKIPSGIPAGVQFGNKTGSLWLTDGLMEGDAAIVRAPSGTYAVAIIGVKNARNWAVARLSKIVYEHLAASSITPASWGSTNLVTTVTANLRETPGGTILGTAPTGTRLVADSSNRVWYRVALNGSWYWIHHSTVATRY